MEKLFIICGNHTKLPFAVTDVTEPQTMAGIRPNQRRVSVAADGQVDYQPTGMKIRSFPECGMAMAATGRLAPGGYIVSTDPDGKTWELWSAGSGTHMTLGSMRMEKSLPTTPIWNGTSACHGTDQHESTTQQVEVNLVGEVNSKWPAAYPDGLPAMVDIGPGSPVGAAFEYGAKIPASIRKLYICDWTFGTMYAIHLTPSGSTYTAEKEEFVAERTS